MPEFSVCPEYIETERLYLRLPQPGDGAEVNAAIRETYADLHQWMPWADHIPEVEETEQRRLSALEGFKAGKHFQVQAHRKVDDSLVVLAGLTPLNEAVPSFEIGYWCRARHQGQGYVSETVRALTPVAFEILGANRVEIHCDEHNLASRRVAERSGYRLEAVLRNHRITPGGELGNTVIYALLPEEYREVLARSGIRGVAGSNTDDNRSAVARLRNSIERMPS